MTWNLPRMALSGALMAVGYVGCLTATYWQFQQQEEAGMVACLPDSFLPPDRCLADNGTWRRIDAPGLSYKLLGISIGFLVVSLAGSAIAMRVNTPKAESA